MNPYCRISPKNLSMYHYKVITIEFILKTNKHLVNQIYFVTFTLNIRLNMNLSPKNH